MLIKWEAYTESKDVSFCSVKYRNYLKKPKLFLSTHIKVNQNSITRHEQIKIRLLMRLNNGNPVQVTHLKFHYKLCTLNS